MSKKQAINYWLFQAKPHELKLREALQAEAINTFSVRTHKKKIKEGDKVILWQTGKLSGCYALCTVASDVGNWPVTEKELNFYEEEPEAEERVKISVDYNLWNKPVTSDILPKSNSFARFFGGLPGTNYKAEESQFKEIVDIIRQQDLVNEPSASYLNSSIPFHPLNQILYGPPGTGKTFYTINYALSIIENRPLEELALEDRAQLKRRYDEYADEGLIHFVTFHQAFSYEDFVEGIKPHTEEKKVVYEINDGIFKHICMYARRNMVESMMMHMPQTEIEIEFNHLYKAFLKYIKSDEFDAFITTTKKKIMLHRTVRGGNISVRRENSFLVYTVLKSRLKKLYQEFPLDRPVQDIDKEINAIVKGANPTILWAAFSELKKFEQQYVAQILNTEEQELTVNDEQIQAFDLNQLSELGLNHARRFVLIIDEINRGNIASIFGDTITLIEDDKREGAKESLGLLLPYSKTWFAVPRNLYIVGTMNTADRSIETMDIALRRRFTFREMPPNPEIIKTQAEKPIAAGVDLGKMLEAINRRIEILLDKEYRIGHSYFMDIESLEDIQRIFNNKIIPLLQEYFFGDYGKIGLVLGKDFIKEKKTSTKDVFADFDHEYANELAEKKAYSIANVYKLEAASFIRIYDKNFLGEN